MIIFCYTPCHHIDTQWNDRCSHSTGVFHDLMLRRIRLFLSKPHLRYSFRSSISAIGSFSKVKAEVIRLTLLVIYFVIC